ncbi:T-complex protein 1 subunit theta-like [Oscarella lobularis]|uniref:T-complex protein 1 subunit theta-like n=1 Tax=Oscarella lobularis TaxID=121494 RepID=UPI003313A113
MALHVPRGLLAGMMKDGARRFHGMEEAVYRNIDACKELTRVTRTSYGPNGMNKMIINHLGKLFVTNDAATVVHELEVEHPAAKLIVMASEMQEQEVGDGTNFVLVFAGALLSMAEDLLRMGLSVAEVISGYEMASEKALEILPGLTCSTTENMKDEAAVTAAVKTAVASKQYGNEDFLAGIIAKACVSVMPSDSSRFNVDNIRVQKILGSGVLQSSVIRGMVFKREVEGDVTKVTDAKIVVYSCALDAMQTETKGTVLIKTAKELLDLSKGEEDVVEKQIKAIVDAGCNVVVTGSTVGDLARHYCNKYGLFVVRLQSKFDLRRLCKATKATALAKMIAPKPEERGHCSEVYVTEIGNNNVTVFRQDLDEGEISTIVIRGSTENVMDDIERAIDDGVNTVKCLTRDNRFLPGAGAVEVELAKQITSYGESCPGLAQYSIKKFAEALEAVPRVLAENAGVKANELISKLQAAHQEGQANMGFDNEGEGPAIKDVLAANILDPFLVKQWALKLTVNAVLTVLRVDQIIMAKRAGGPKPQENKHWDDD